MDAARRAPQPTPVTSLRPGWALSLLALGLAGMALAMLLTAFDAAGEAALWENLHWTLAGADPRARRRCRDRLLGRQRTARGR